MQGFAVFDLDETITTRGTWGRFVSLSLKRRPFTLLLMWICAGFSQIIYKLGLRDRMSVKLIMLRMSLSGKTKTELKKLANDFADNEIRSGLRPGAVKNIEAHKAAGDHIIIASAGADLIVEAIASRLGIETVLSTQLAWVDEDADAHCARNFGSQNCYGRGKLARLQKCLETFPDFQRSAAYITVYSDSYSDLPALKYADKGVAVNGDRKLLKAAEIYGFETVNWSV